MAGGDKVSPVDGLRSAITAALAAAEWPHRDDGPPLAIGTSLFVAGQLVGGSVQPFDSVGVVRVIAFGAASAPDDRRAALDALCGLVNPRLLDVTFEIDPVLALPVCRATVRVDDLADPAVAAHRVLEALGAVTANFVAHLPALVAVTDEGIDPTAALELIVEPGSAPPD